MKITLKASKYKLKVILFSSLIALVVSLISWDKINPRGYFIDRESYFFAYNYKSYRLDGFEAEKLYDFITNEWLWRYINSYSKNILNLSPEYFFGIITFLSFLTYSVFVLSHTKRPLALVYLLNSGFISFIYSQLRLAFAMSIFIIGLELLRRKRFILSLVVFISCFLIHTSMLIFITLLLISVIVSRLQKSNFTKLIIVFTSGLSVNILIGPLREFILSSVDDRRAEYADFSPPIYWYLIYVFYFLIIIYLALKYKLRVFDNYIYTYACIIFSLLVTSLFLGGYTSRFVVATMLFIIPTLFLLKGKASVLFHYIYIIYFTFLWIGFLT